MDLEFEPRENNVIKIRIRCRAQHVDSHVRQLKIWTTLKMKMA
jgi:hypothetical protein